MVAIKQVVEIEGVKYTLEGDLDFSNLTIKKVGDKPTEPPVEPPVEPTEPGTEIDPTIGTVKTGSKWSKNPNENKPWKAVAMSDDDKKGLFKIVDKEGLNVIADLESEDVANKLIEYFKTNPFPPTEEPTEPTTPTEPTEPPVEGVQEIEGIKIPYKSTGKYRKDPAWNKRDDGLRLDYKGNGKNGEYVNSIQVFYGGFKGDVPDDDITFKWSWARHTGSAIVKAYGIGLNNKNGKTRGRMEWKHPDYTGNLANGTGGLPIEKGKSFGYMGVKKTLPNGNILLEYYQDKGGLDASGKPSNQWVKVLTWEDKEYKVTDYSENGVEATTRIDDDSKGWENIDVKLSLLIEIQP